MPATISSTFRIVVDETLTFGAAAAAANFTLPRACRVVAFYVTTTTPLAATRWALSNLTTGVDITSPPSVPIGGAGDILDDRPIPILLAGQEQAAGDVIEVRCFGGAGTRYVIECEASNPQTLTVT
jgi:hypothetical protein